MPLNPAIIASLIGAGGTVAGSLLGRKSRAAVPKDIEPLRAQQLQLLQALLQPGGIEKFFGPLGVPQSDLQRQAAGGISQFLNQPAPEQRAFDVSRPILEGMLTGTGPQFERDISMANQQGGRFGSANAILRGEALRHLFNQRTQTAETLGMLAGQAGQNPFGRLLAGGGFGTELAKQGDIGTQRLIQLLSGILGVGQQTAFNLPITQQPNFLEQGGSALSGLSQLLALLPLLQGRGAPTGRGRTGGGGQPAGEGLFG